MYRFRVWAPAAKRADVLIDGRTLALAKERDGWWELTDPDAGPGTRYQFCIDGGTPRPDPRSASQPEGVDGPSEVIDHGAFVWTDPHWKGLPLAGAVLYELHIGTFSPEGTFDGAIAHLPHLVELGVDAIELMPVAEFSGTRGWGYDGVDLFAPHHSYGGPEGLKRLVDACHAAGLGILLDVVYNHLGPAGNYLPEFGPYFSHRHKTNWGDALNFGGPNSGEVRRFVIDNALMWLRDYHFDGLRLDAVHAIVDESAVHLLEQMASEVNGLSAHVGRNLCLIAESDLNDPKFVRSTEAGGYGLDACWADEWHHALHSVLTGEKTGYYKDFGSMELLAKALRQAWVYDGIWSAHRSRIHGRPVGNLTGDRFIISTQNHDQVGNRALGERLSALTSPGRLKVAAALMLTSPFVPLLFQGEEWGAATPFQYFTDHGDPELGRAVSEGRRNEFSSFGWQPDRVPDPQEVATFDRSRLDWSELNVAFHKEMFEWYRSLIALRRRLPSLTDPQPDRRRVEFDDVGWLTVRTGDVLVAVNLGEGTAGLPAGGYDQALLSTHPEFEVTHDTVWLTPDSVAIIGRSG